jgi:hypothetical protein
LDIVLSYAPYAAGVFYRTLSTACPHPMRMKR